MAFGHLVKKALIRKKEQEERDKIEIKKRILKECVVCNVLGVISKGQNINIVKIGNTDKVILVCDAHLTSIGE